MAQSLRGTPGRAREGGARGSPGTCAARRAQDPIFSPPPPGRVTPPGRGGRPAGPPARSRSLSLLPAGSLQPTSARLGCAHRRADWPRPTRAPPPALDSGSAAGSAA